jgi:release factor glutamine methyltransferase
MTVTAAPERAPANKQIGGNARAALSRGIERLTGAGAPSPGLSAELLLLHVLNRDRSWLYAHPEHLLDAAEATRYAAFIEQRAAGVPTQYLTGRQEFWGLDIEVNPSVLIPRPETEHLIEVALELLAARRSEPLDIADVGTGSGCIVAALAHEFSRARAVATDVSAPALEVARRNADRLGMATRIQFAQMNWLEGYLTSEAADDSGTCFDLIVSNPPYIGTDDAHALPDEVRDHEPSEALYGGPAGIDAYGPLVAQAERLLRPDGWLILELGHGAARRVQSLIDGRLCWADVSVTNDLAGIPRVLSARRT